MARPIKRPAAASVHGGKPLPPGVMPAGLIKQGRAAERRAWYMSQGLHQWPAQHAALVASRRHHEIVEEDPSDVLREGFAASAKTLAEGCCAPKQEASLIKAESS